MKLLIFGLFFLILPVSAFFIRKPLSSWVLDHNKSKHFYSSLSALIAILTVLLGFIYDWSDFRQQFNPQASVTIRNDIISDLDSIIKSFGNKGLQNETLQLQLFRGRLSDEFLSPSVTTSRLAYALMGFLSGMWISLFIVSLFFSFQKTDRMNGYKGRIDSLEKESLVEKHKNGIYLKLNNVIQNMALSKIVRITKESEHFLTKDKCAGCLQILNPDEQLSQIVRVLHDAYKKHSGSMMSASLRSALFLSKEGYLYCAASFDGHRYDCVTSPNAKNKEFFALDGDRKSFAVNLWFDAFGGNGYCLLNEKQDFDAYPGLFRAFPRPGERSGRGHTQSILGIRLAIATPYPALIGCAILDSDHENYFDDADKQLTAVLQQDLSLRVDLELKTGLILNKANEDSHKVARRKK